MIPFVPWKEVNAEKPTMDAIQIDQRRKYKRVPAVVLSWVGVFVLVGAVDLWPPGCFCGNAATLTHGRPLLSPQLCFTSPSTVLPEARWSFMWVRRFQHWFKEVWEKFYHHPCPDTKLGEFSIRLMRCSLFISSLYIFLPGFILHEYCRLYSTICIV